MDVKIEENKHCECSSCNHNNGFYLPKEIIEATKNGELVIFAGAGVSTESKKVYKTTLYSDICREMIINPEDNLSFSQLMSKQMEEQNY
ncbi:hypothetical protein [Paenibacillus sp. KN14-4R]|uniref:hypothetical protein n=1 Tax=Paenibacillus sp. KN14-4R TaxID=3445773 RepID=UPI003F9F7D82